jgi:hypothetical protein
LEPSLCPANSPLSLGGQPENGWPFFYWVNFIFARTRIALIAPERRSIKKTIFDLIRDKNVGLSSKFARSTKTYGDD